MKIREGSILDLPARADQRVAGREQRAIDQLNDENWEYSSIVFYHDGKVGFTEPFTGRLPDRVNLVGGDDWLPAGAVILGIVHNHPDIYSDHAGYPSVVDWQGYNQILTADFGRGITVDSNLLYYIYTDDDHKTRVYDKTDKSKTSNSCALQ